MNVFWWLIKRVSQLGLTQLTNFKFEDIATSKLNKEMLKRKRAELRKWLKFLIHLAQKDPSNPRKENYEQHWNYTSFKDKTVLDLGADYGSTASWFLRKGARRVIAVEGHPVWAFGLRAIMGRHPQIVCIQKFLDSPKDIENLIHTFKPNLVKVDIEGHENLLLELPKETLHCVPEWLIEAHGVILYFEIMINFSSSGFTCHICSHALGHMGYPSCTILHCKK